MTEPDTNSGLGLRLFSAVVVCFLLAPIAIAVVMAFSSGERLVFPPAAFSLRWFSAVIDSSLLMDSLKLSLVIATASTVLATIAGTAAAVALDHYRFVGRTPVQAFLMLPLAIPAIVLGLGMLFSLPLFGMRVGALAAIVGHAVLGLPYVVAMVLASLANFDRTLERASLNLGVGPFQTFFRITLPHIRIGVLAGAVATFLLSLDNISLSIFVTRNDTLPLRLMQQMLSYADPSIAAMSTLLLVASFVLLLFLLPFLARRRN